MESNCKADEYRQWMTKLNEYYPDYSSQINKLSQYIFNKKKKRYNDGIYYYGLH
jgi:hypothetical protein